MMFRVCCAQVADVCLIMQLKAAAPQAPTSRQGRQSGCAAMQQSEWPAPRLMRLQCDAQFPLGRDPIGHLRLRGGGGDGGSTGAESRSSYLEMYREKRDDKARSPDYVASPGAHEERSALAVALVLRLNAQKAEAAINGLAHGPRAATPLCAGLRRLDRAGSSDNENKLLQVDPAQQRHGRWTQCSFSGQPLVAPIVADEGGALYNKADLLQGLADKAAGGAWPEGLAHITRLKDLLPVRPQANPGYERCAPLGLTCRYIALHATPGRNLRHQGFVFVQFVRALDQGCA